MDPATRQALRDVVSYNWDDELRDFQNAVDVGDVQSDDDGHVFTKLVSLDNFLNETNRTPTSYLENR